jgi:hypothetical protein
MIAAAPTLAARASTIASPGIRVTRTSRIISEGAAAWIALISTRVVRRVTGLTMTATRGLPAPSCTALRRNMGSVTLAADLPPRDQRLAA